MRYLTLLFALLLLTSGHARAQQDEYALQKVQFELYDVDNRDYRFQSGEAVLAVRLLGKDSNPGLEGVEAVEADGTSYTVDGTDREFEIVGNVAEAAFVVFRDPQREPLNYRLAILLKSDPPVEVPFAEGGDVYAAGPLQEGAAPAETRFSTERAPQAWEYGTLAALGLVGLLFAYLVFGRALFRKMLFGARMPVTAALTLSNLLVLGAIMALLLTVALAWFFPLVSGYQLFGYPIPYAGYVYAAVGYLAIVCLAWLVGHLAWR